MHDHTHYREICSRDDIVRIMHHGHWIPATRGITRAFVDSHYPGWTWNELLDVFLAAGVVRKGQGTGHPAWVVDDSVLHVAFNDPHSFAALWDDGTLSRR